MGKKDYILIAVLYGSLLAGIFFPGPSATVSGTIKYLMMTMLFLAFIKISPADVGRALMSNWSGMIWETLLRLVIAPAVAYWITLALYPPLALPILLLAGVSTGVSFPFFTFVLRALAPKLLEPMNWMSYPISMVVAARINFGALGRYIPYLKTS